MRILPTTGAPFISRCSLCCHTAPTFSGKCLLRSQKSPSFQVGTQLPPWWSGDRHPGGVHGGVHPEILGGSHAHILPVHWGHQGRSVLPGPPRFPAHPENIQTPPGSTGHEPRGLSYSMKAKNQKFKEEALTERQGGYRGCTANPGFLQRRTPRPHSDNRVLGQEVPGGDGGRGGGEGQRGWAGAAGNAQLGRHRLPGLAWGHQTAPHTTDPAAGSHFCSTRMSVDMMKTLESLTEEGRVTHLNLKPEGVSDLHLAFPRWH